MRNPAQIELYPPTLPVEIAMRKHPVPTICAAYGISREEFYSLRNDPIFLQDLEGCLADMQDRKKAIQMKARLQSDALLNTSWDLIHGPAATVPANVKADLIKATWRMAGLDDAKSQVGGAGNNLQINIVMEGD